MLYPAAEALPGTRCILLLWSSIKQTPKPPFLSRSLKILGCSRIAVFLEAKKYPNLYRPCCFEHMSQLHPRWKGHCRWRTFMDIHDVKTQRFKGMLYKPIILAMDIYELWWPNLDMAVHEISLPKWLDYTSPLMKRCVLTSWKSMVVHGRPLVAMEVHGRFRLGLHWNILLNLTEKFLHWKLMWGNY